MLVLRETREGDGTETTPKKKNFWLQFNIEVLKKKKTGENKCKTIKCVCSSLRSAVFSRFLLVRSTSLVSESRNEPGATSHVGHIQPRNSKNHPEDPEHTDLFLWVSIEGADPLSACHTEDIQDFTQTYNQNMFMREDSQSC